MKVTVEMKVNGSWKVWKVYEESACGLSAKERAEQGMKVASCYGECRIVEG